MKNRRKPYPASRDRASRRPGARKESAVSIVSKLSRPGLLIQIPQETCSSSSPRAGGGAWGCRSGGAEPARANEVPRKRNGRPGSLDRSGNAHAPHEEPPPLSCHGSDTKSTARERPTASNLVPGLRTAAPGTYRARESDRAVRRHFGFTRAGTKARGTPGRFSLLRGKGKTA